MYQMQFGLKPLEPWNCSDQRRIRSGRKISRHEQPSNVKRRRSRSLMLRLSARRGAGRRAR